MKTKFEIEFETKDMKEVRENEDGTGDIITREVERDLHEQFGVVIKRLFDEGEIEEQLLDDSDIQVEGFEHLEDYGNVQMNVKEIKEGV